MTRLTIDTGVLGNPTTGDTLRTAMGKINSNFIELYADVAASGLGGQLTNPTTNGDIKIQPNGTGIVEIDQLQVGDAAITSMITNGDVNITGNGVGGVKIEAININGTSISSEDSTTININDGLIVDGDLTLTGAVSGSLNVDNGITITDNSISSSASNANLELSASGTGEIEALSDLLLKGSEPFLKIQRTDNANVPGIDFVGQAGTSGAKILFDGTSGTANELIFQTFTVAGGLAEAFRVQQGGAKVTGSLDIDAGITIADNTITTSASNADLELTASGTGAVKVDAILSLPDGSASDNYVGVGDDDDLKIFHNGSHSIIRETGTGNLFLQSDNNVIIGKDSSSETMIKGVADGAVELYHDNTKKFETSADGVAMSGKITGLTDPTADQDAATKAYVDSQVVSAGGTGAITFSGNTMTSASNADIEITPGGTGNVNLNGDTVRVGDNDANATITTQGTGDLILNTNAGTNSGTITLRDGSNGDIILEPDGTGDVLLKGNKVGVGTVNQPDTLLHLKDTNSVITLQRTNDANTPGLSFQQSGGNVRGVIKLDGTSGTSNEIFMQTYDGSSLAERFRVTHTGAKVSGTLNVDDGISITDNTITTSASNADLELKASGTGSVSIDGIQISGTEISSADSTQVTIKENLHVTGTVSGTIDASGLTGTLPAISGANITGVSKFAFRTVQIGGGDTLVADDASDTLTINPGTNVTITDDQSSDAFTINVNGMGDLTFNGSTIISPSNADITLDPAGTGQVVANAAFKFNAGYIENINTLTSSSTITVDCSLASIHKVTLGVSTEFNITNLPTGGTVTLIITQDGSGSRTATFGTDGSTAVKFPGGAPTLSTGAADIDVVTIVNDGTNFLGNCAKNYS